MRTNGLGFRRFRVLFCVAILALLSGGTVYGDESCITCHTDEDLLEEFLAESEQKTSALQAGSG